MKSFIKSENVNVVKVNILGTEFTMSALRAWHKSVTNSNGKVKYSLNELLNELEEENPELLKRISELYSHYNNWIKSSKNIAVEIEHLALLISDVVGTLSKKKAKTWSIKEGSKEDGEDLINSILTLKILAPMILGVCDRRNFTYDEAIQFVYDYLNSGRFSTLVDYMTNIAKTMCEKGKFEISDERIRRMVVNNITKLATNRDQIDVFIFVILKNMSLFDKMKQSGLVKK